MSDLKRIECHRMAQFICAVHAKSLADARCKPRMGRTKKLDWHNEYDAMAATELGELLYKKLVIP